MASPKSSNTLHLQRLRVVLLCWLQPFFYGAATRAPLIYIGVYAYQQLLLPWWQVGLLIATYQAARALANLLIPLVGVVTAHITGVLLGLAGYAIHRFSRDYELAFWFACGLIGMSEVITCMQHYAKLEYGPFGLSVLRERLRLQYAFNVAGTAVAFAVAGNLYQYTLHADAWFGMALQCGELISLLSYLAIVRYAPQSAPDEALMHRPLITMGISLPSVGGLAGETVVQRASLKHLNAARSSVRITLLSEDTAEAQETLADIAGLEVDVRGLVEEKELERVLSGSKAKGNDGPTVPWINYMIALTFAAQALMIGTILSTAPILLSVEYDINLSYVGYIFAAGEVLGTIALFTLAPAAHQAAVRRYFPGPFNMLIIIGTLGCFAMLLRVPNNVSSVVAIVIIMGLNDFGTSLTAEAQGATVAAAHYPRMNMLGNLARRLGNMTTAALGPIMFGAAFYLPFVVFGALTVVWVLGMTFAFQLRGNQLAAQINADAAATGGEEVPGGLKLYARAFTFVSAENRAAGVELGAPVKH